MSADPERIRSQICDNIALMEELKRKEGALESVKESARGILEQAKPNDAAIAGSLFSCYDRMSFYSWPNERYPQVVSFSPSYRGFIDEEWTAL